MTVPYGPKAETMKAPPKYSTMHVREVQKRETGGGFSFSIDKTKNDWNDFHKKGKSRKM